MKLYLTIAIIASSLAIHGIMPQAFSQFQKDISIQAAGYKGSQTHQAMQARDTRSYIVGDSKTFWRWNLSVMPPLWIQTPATCRAVGEHSYVFVADSEWNTHMTQANVDTIMVRLEQNTPNNPTQGAIAMDIGLFGPIPNELDNDEKLIVFYSALGSFQGTSFDGYFSAYNQVTEAEAQQMNPTGHSNECEMIYMTCYPLSPIAPIRLSVLAHELEHLIHWGQDPNEQAWLDEGCAELAMVVYGIPDPISGFNSNPDNDLTTWNQTTADYVKVMLFFTYLQEHYDETGLISSLVADPANGMVALNNQVSIHYPQLDTGKILRNWNVANAIDDPLPGNGLYNYAQLNLPNFYMTSANQYPNLADQSVSPYAADYLSYLMPAEPIHFVLQTNAPLYVTAILFDESNQCIAVNDGELVNQIDIGIGTGDAVKVVFVISNPNSGSATYSYSIGTVAFSDPLTPAARTPEMACYPNPFHADNGKLEVLIANYKQAAKPGKVAVYNLKGQCISKLQTGGSANSGALQAFWNGRDSDNQSVASGVYLLRYADDKQSISKAVYLVK